ncbi:tumor necrosis factor alpha-induced protein 2a [Cololabis saira]|uniref:tumor necrosis factor alpha-induced protein 2a n=1 Tax=Cololabis saira TaxID=129043 RepID=UPI002AD58186|nr:tumor necrosis factor alpha-induced protein 2a [Cololabis saira]
MSTLFHPCKCLQFKAGDGEAPGGGGWSLSGLRCCPDLWSNVRLQRHRRGGKLQGEKQMKEPLEEGELQTSSRRLILREEQLFSREAPSEEDTEQLQEDFTALRVQVWGAVSNTFTSCPSSAEHLEALRSAVACIQQQEKQDRRWTGEDHVPPWRPMKFLSHHNTLLQEMVEDRLKTAAEDESRGGHQLSKPVKIQVYRMGLSVREDLLAVARTVRDCYPPEMDVLNTYAGLYHHTFSRRLSELAASELEADEGSYVLLWVNQEYQEQVLKHGDLDGQVDVDRLGPLLQQDHLDRLEEQFMTHKQDKVELWLNRALRKEEESWCGGGAPELIDGYYFNPLAMEVIMVMQESRTGFNCAIKDQNKAQGLSGHLETFLNSYRTCVEEFLKGNHGNVYLVMKAQLVCEEQFRDYVSAQTEFLSEERRRRCLDSLTALRDSGFRLFIAPLQDKIKAGLKKLWTSSWVDGSVPIIDSLLDHLDQHLPDLTDLKPTCRQSLLSVLHQDVVIRYVKRVMKTKKKSTEDQRAGAQRMTEDAQKMDRFFVEQSGSEPSWLCQVLFSIAEIIRLQDADSVHVELITLVRRYPDISGAHVSALMELKGLSAHCRSYKRSMNESRPTGDSTNHRPLFFSKVEVKSYKKKMKSVTKFLKRP